MCGINGIISCKKISNLTDRIDIMNKSIRHRGPDDHAVWCNDTKNIGLGHQRLSIIDLNQRSKQPMCSNSGRWMIVYNGEIYNYKILKDRTAYQYKTNSDTEVILAYVEEFGVEQFLKDSNGMFAICFLDLQEKAAYLCRDRLGIKPIFYYQKEDQLIFSSEIKGILNSGLVEAQLNEGAIDEYLGNRYVRAPYTFFQNIYQVLPGTYIKFDSELKYQEIRYWTIPTEFNMATEYNETKIMEEFEERLSKSITNRLIADVPVGTYLSGGVDSSLISAIAAIHTGNELNTYTIGFDEMNEFSYAKQVANQYNTSHHEIKMTKAGYFSLIDSVIGFKDAPLGVPNEILLSKMLEELKKKITVVLSGEGADELLGGYGKIFRSSFDYGNLSIKSSYYDYLISLYEYVPRDIRDEYLTVKKPYRDIFDGQIKSEFKGRANEENIFRFFHNYHVTGLLQRVDTTTMLAGVEARVPFLDHTLIEYAYKCVPYSMKLRWKPGVDERLISSVADSYSENLDIPKYLLKKVSEKYLPGEVIYRKKMGFPVPLNNWFDNLEASAQEILKDAYWLKKACVDQLVAACHINFRAGQTLWMFLNVELFRKKYFLREWRY